MITPTQLPVPAESRVLLKGISWPTFEAMLEELGESRVCRLAYDQGLLEIMVPYQDHEEPKVQIANFIEVVADELGIEIRQLGSLTLKREDLSRAIEPDTCFYIQNEALVRGKSIDLATDPPPDLALEVDFTSRSLDKLHIYASLGVPEFWRYENQILMVYKLVDGQYKRCDQSPTFPFLPIQEIPSFIEQSKILGQRSAVRLFRLRIRSILQNQSL